MGEKCKEILLLAADGSSMEEIKETLKLNIYVSRLRLLITNSIALKANRTAIDPESSSFVLK